MSARLPHPEQISQVLIPDLLMPALENWLAERGMGLTALYIEDDIPTYSLSVPLLPRSARDPQR